MKAACKRLGLELVEGQKTYRWWGRSEGDYPLPEGFTAQDLGHCEHAIRVPLSHPSGRNAYEVGVVKRRDGKPGYQLMWDFFAGGYGLQEFVGEDCKKLRQAYATEAAKAQARKMGYRVTEKLQANGSIKLVLAK